MGRPYARPPSRQRLCPASESVTALALGTLLRTPSSTRTHLPEVSLRHLLWKRLSRPGAAMPGLRYSFEELHALRESPLVKRPEGLPNIEQWFEYVSSSAPVKAPPDAVQIRTPSQRQSRAQEAESNTRQRGGALEARATRYNSSGRLCHFLSRIISTLIALQAMRMSSLVQK